MAIDQQWQKRADLKVRDPHQRTWNTVVDMTDKRRGACGPVNPMFAAPWYPDQKYLTVDGFRFSVAIDYDRCIADCEEAARQYDERLHAEAVKMFSSAAPQAIQKRDPVLMREVGPPPMDPRWAKAAKAGNPWVLGVPGYGMPDWAKALVAEKVARQRAVVDELAYAPADVSDVDHFEDYSEQYDRQAVGGTKVKTGGKGRAKATTTGEE